MIAERIRPHRKLSICHASNHRVTVNIGVSSSYVDGYGIQQMTIGTIALYRAKNKGRNRVEGDAGQ